MTTPSEAFEIAVAHHRAGRLDAAAVAYREAIRLQPGYGKAHNNLGTVLKEQGQLEAAMACYRTALASAPEMAEPYYNLGIALAAQGRTDEALDAYRAAIDRQPNYVRALVNYGSLIERQGRLDEALACYDRASCRAGRGACASWPRQRAAIAGRRGRRSSATGAVCESRRTLPNRTTTWRSCT